MYEEFYRLNGKPFQVSADARFYYNSSGHNRAMAYLRYGLRQGEGFIVITGGIGTGKTMLVRNLFKELEHENIVAAQLVSTQVAEEDVLRMISSAFGLEYDGLSKAALLRNLEAFFRARHAEGRRVLLVVDEAQNLPRRSIEELRMLSNYQEDGQALLQSFLLGQAELKSTLQSTGMEQVRQRIIAGYHLRPLDRDEAKEYIEYRLKLVDWRGDPAITEEAYDQIHEATGGVPRRINALLDRLLLFGALDERHELDAEATVQVVAEVQQEVGYANDPESFGDFGEAETDQPAQPAAGVQPTVPGDVLTRIANLEYEVATLKEQAYKNRQLLKAAIMMELGVDDDGEQ